MKGVRGSNTAAAARVAAAASACPHAPLPACPPRGTRRSRTAGSLIAAYCHVPKCPREKMVTCHGCPCMSVSFRSPADMPDRWPLQHHHLQRSHRRWRGGRPVDLALRLLCDMPDRRPLRGCHLQCSLQHWRRVGQWTWPCPSSVTCLIAGRCDAVTYSAAASAGKEAGQ